MSDIEPTVSEPTVEPTLPAAPLKASRPGTAVKLQNNRVTYDGKAGKIFGISIVNFFLSILTLGIYSFWGKTRIRRYLLSSVAVNQKDRLQYTGTPMELLLGWLKAMAVVIPVVLVLSWAGETGHFIIYLVFLIGFYALFHFGVYLALRYRLTRAKWRGIRFGLRGKGLEFMKLSMIRGLINIVTLGYAIPASDIQKWRYIANNMSFGKTSFTYTGNSKSLIVTNLVTLWVPLILMLLYLVSSWSEISSALTFMHRADQIKQMQQETGQVSPQDQQAAKGFVMTMATAVPLFYALLAAGFLGRLWYRAALRVERLRGLKLGSLRFKSTATGKGYLKLKFLNVLIMIVTLGLGFAIVKNRNMKYEATTIMVGGNLNELMAAQADPNRKSDVGDALAPELDLGAAVSIGI